MPERTAHEDPVTFVLIPGAGGEAAYYAELIPELEARGHAANAVDIPADDPSLGLTEYAALVDRAIGDQRGVVLVAQSMGGFTAPLITQRSALSRIVLLNAMIPLPGEAPGEFFVTTRGDEVRRAAEIAAGRSGEFDTEETFFHDVPADVKARVFAADERHQSDTPFGQACEFESWPDVPIHVLVGADARLFPVGYQVRLAADRLGIDADVMPGGHLVALSRPRELADRLVGYLA